MAEGWSVGWGLGWPCDRSVCDADDVLAAAGLDSEEEAVGNGGEGGREEESGGRTAASSRLRARTESADEKRLGPC